jgi:Flp pilus assembly protein TadD
MNCRSLSSQPDSAGTECYTNSALDRSRAIAAPSSGMSKPTSEFYTARLLTFAALLALTACAAVGPAEPPIYADDRARLLAGQAILGDRVLPEIEDVDILAVDDAMGRFLDAHVDLSTRLPERLDQLLDAVVEDKTFGLNYDGHTRTARGTFHNRNGNCLAFTNMFVALARSVGLDARFQEVDIPPLWDRQGDTVILNRHVNVNVQNVVDGGVLGMQTMWGRRNEHGRVIDFNITDFRTFFRTRLRSDERAFAHYYSNLGAEALRDGDSPRALAYLRRALDLEPRFSAAWTNLGVLYSRDGAVEEAALAYRLALHYDDENVTAKSNLARTLAAAGSELEAQRLQTEVENYRRKSPYFRYHAAREAIGRGDFEQARRDLEYAVRKQPREERFHFALSLVQERLGNDSAAQRALKRAQGLAEDPQQSQRYAYKLRMLRVGVGPEPPLD